MIYWRFACEKPSVSYKSFDNNNKKYTWYELCEILEKQYFGYIVITQLYKFDCACFVAWYEEGNESVLVSPFSYFESNKDYFLILKRIQREKRRNLYLKLFGNNWWNTSTILDYRNKQQQQQEKETTKKKSQPDDEDDDNDNDIVNFLQEHQQPKNNINNNHLPSYINVTNKNHGSLNNSKPGRTLLQIGGQSTVLMNCPRTKDGRECKRLYSTLKGKVKRMLYAVSDLPKDMNLEQFVVYQDEKETEFIDVLQLSLII